MVAADLSPLLARAFHTDTATRATAALAEIREQRGGRAARVRAYEVVVPEGADRAWFEASLLRPLVYFCESGRAPLPACPGVFVALFAGDTLHCIDASEVVSFGCALLGVDSEELVRRFGTGEVRHALRRDD
ncbi:STAUR_1299 family protein [Chondromyces apiculatus]|nr:STAUR_1299 family protein [Chondromyces apiculatus]